MRIPAIGSRRTRFPWASAAIVISPFPKPRVISVPCG